MGKQLNHNVNKNKLLRFEKYLNFVIHLNININQKHKRKNYQENHRDKKCIKIQYIEISQHC